MSRSCAVAFQSIQKSLGQETRLKTLELYKSLLRSSDNYQNAHILKATIRDKFKQNKNVTSRPKVLELLSEADKTQQFLEKGSLDNQCIIRIKAYIEQHQKKNTTQKRIDIPTTTVPKKAQKKETKRKPYQVAITTQHSSGYEFKRVRSWRQPVQTAMMLKNRVKTIQSRLDRHYEYMSQLEMIRSERTFLENLGCLPKDRLKGYETSIKMAINANKHDTRKPKGNTDDL